MGPTKSPVETDQNVTDTVEVKFKGAANNSNFPAEDFKKALAERLKTQPKRFHIASSTSKMLNQTDFHGEATITLDILHLKDEKKMVADVEKSLMALKNQPFGKKGEDFMITSVVKVPAKTTPPTASPKSSPPSSSPTSSGVCVMPTLLGLFAALAALVH